MINNRDIDRIYELVDNIELKILIDKLVKSANIDELTKVSNRRVLNNSINYDVVVMCDIDNFKDINDRYGHIVGDKVLVLVSDVIKTVIRSEDFICRYGGDEFVLVFKDCSTLDICKRLENIKESINNVISEYSIVVTMSFGITEYEKGKELMAAIEEADQALYISKQNGKNRITIFKEKIKK